MSDENDLALLQMLAATQSLQASHEVTSELERSKYHVEQVIDHMNNFFSVITEKGNILKANRSIAIYFHADLEEMIGRNMREIFSEESWNIMLRNIDVLSESQNREMCVEFELNVEYEGIAKEFLWNIRKFSDIEGNFECLYQVMAQDISAVKEYEKKLSHIFSCIPLGIMTIAEEARITGPYSAYAEYLLGVDSLADQILSDILIENSEGLNEFQKNALQQLTTYLGEDEMWFESSKKQLPSEVRMVHRDRDIWIGLSFHAVLRDGVIEKFMIIVKDITDIVKRRNDSHIQKESEEKFAKKVTEIKFCDPAILENTMIEFEFYKKNLLSALEKQNTPSHLCKILHGLKGVARTSMFHDLKEKAHFCEGELKEHNNIPHVRQHIDDTLEELDLVLETYAMVHSRDIIVNLKNDIQRRQDFENNLIHKIKEFGVDPQAIYKFFKDHSPDYIQIKGVEQTIISRSQKTAALLGKNVTISFDWENVVLFKGSIPYLQEIMNHLINNSIDHGFENHKKNTIHICGVQDEDGLIEIKISDNGKGFNLDKIKQKVVEEKISSQDDVVNLEEKDILSLVFKEGISTSQDVNEVSGRGIGMSAVLSALEELKSSDISVENRKEGGASLKFSFYS